MARRKRFSTVGATSAAATAPSKGMSSGGLQGLWEQLTKPRKTNDHLILSTLATLVDNGVSLPKALATLAKEDSLSRHREVLETIRRKVESGIAFSTAISQFPHMCNKLTVNQIRLRNPGGNPEKAFRDSKQNSRAEERRDQATLLPGAVDLRW